MKKKTIGKEYIFTALILFVVLAVTMVLDSQLPGYHIVIKVIKKASVYSLVAVSMNLLNGFTGLFSLGQAGFMLLGAYSYAVLCIPVAKRAGGRCCVCSPYRCWRLRRVRRKACRPLPRSRRLCRRNMWR